MAAASSGGPRGPSTRRLPAYMDPTNKFGELTFLQMTGKDGVPLPKNPFIIGKSVEDVTGGPIEGANTEAQGTRYTLRVRDPIQVAKLLKMTHLCEGTEVVVEAHPNLNVSRCVISCYDLTQMAEQDVLAELHSQKVVRVQRIMRKEGDKKVNTPALILTFCSTTYPEYIKIGLLRVPTRPYYPNPMLCYGCFTYGHTSARCPGPARCFNCSGRNHGEEECSEAQFCLNCKGNHRPTNRQCPVYKNEMEVIKIKIRDNLTFPEARKRAEQQKKGTYAQATAEQNEVDRKLKELEANMKKKDEHILKLLEATKRKDEKIEQMMAYIQQMKQQINNPEKPQQTSEHKQCHQSAGPVTRSRNNSPAIQQPQRNFAPAVQQPQRNISPAVQESKRGRPQKQNLITNPTTTSPDRESPPAKKSAISTATQNLTYSDEEIEISETPPSQHLR